MTGIDPNHAFLGAVVVYKIASSKKAALDVTDYYSFV
jgi:hypothetical protein